MSCPVCQSNSIIFQDDYRFNHPYFSNLRRVSCSECELNFATPMPKSSSLHKYNTSYHNSAHGGSDRNIKQQAFFSGLAKTRLDFIKKNVYLNSQNSYNVLEIGPGPGAFIKVWMETFTKSTYSVIESDKGCHRDLKRLGVKIIENGNEKENEKYDFIIISHVLEHVANPRDFLNPFIKQLNNGGYLFIEVPCMDWKHKNIDEPHLLFFDKKAMEILLKTFKLSVKKQAYYGITHKKLKNFYNIFSRRLRAFLWRKGITYYHPERNNIFKIVKNNIETQALLSFDAHKEKSEHSWWLRVISKK